MKSASHDADLKFARLLRWIPRILLALAAAFLLLFLGDWAAFSLRGNPTDQISVTRLLAVPLKGNRTEFDSEGTRQLPCARALFPQGSLSPCWYLRRHTTQADQL